MKILKTFFALSVFSIVAITCLHGQTFEYKSHSNAGIAGYTMPYRLFVPSGYDSNTSYPLVLFLHGAGERGTDNNAQLTANRGATLWAENANQAAFPCFVVAPQCPSNAQWVNTNWSNGSYSVDNIPVSTELKMVKDLLETLKTQYNIDGSRLYVTGISMGGYGTWDFILRYPGMFKAAIPICGAGDPSKASLIASLPLRVFHSSDDPIVPVSGSRDMVNAINAQGPNNRNPFYTEYTDQGHFSWVNAYNSSGLVSWLFNASPITVNCSDSPVSAIELDLTSVNINTNRTKYITANVLPDNICNKAIVWSSDNETVATVNQSGLVMGRTAGTAIITATAVNGNIKATCDITVSQTVGETLLIGTQSDNFDPYCCGNDGYNAFDGNIETFVDAVDASGAYTQLDFGSSQNVTKIKYYPRENNALRMTGGVFQGSNDGTDFTNIYTIPSAPGYTWNSINVNVNYRYVRYLSPANGYCNVAEIEFWNFSSPTNSLQEIDNSNNLQIAPNPVKAGEAVTVDGCEHGVIQIYNLNGELTCSNTVANGEFVLPASVKSGLYIVSVCKNQQILKGKLIVK